MHHVNVLWHFSLELLQSTEKEFWTFKDLNNPPLKESLNDKTKTSRLVKAVTLLLFFTFQFENQLRNNRQNSTEALFIHVHIWKRL